MAASIRRLRQSYEAGITPNPCIDCNRYMKFGKLYERAKILGCNYVVTGHYAKIEYDGERYLLREAVDETKDQSYVLYSMTQEQLSHTKFPLGNMRKSEVRELAAKSGFVNAAKPDSQDICFVPDGDYVAFPKPMYVREINTKENTVTLAEEKMLYGTEADLKDFHWIFGETPKAEIRCKTKIRYRHSEQWSTVIPTGNDTAHLIFDEPQRAITPGQAAVLYAGDIVLGGGIIQ